MTDTATRQVQRLGVLNGARISHLSGVGWVHVMRPLLVARGIARPYRDGRGGSAGPRLIAAVDTALTKSIDRLARPPTPDTEADPLTPAALVEHLPMVTKHVRLHLDYDETYGEWLFGELGRVVGLGTLTARLVRNRNGRALGWYVCFIQAGGRARVLHLAAADRDVGRVLDHLLHEAWLGGAAAAQGRLEPRMVEPLGQRRCVMLYRGGALLYSKHEEISPPWRRAKAC
jgi:hypothetical protein